MSEFTGNKNLKILLILIINVAVGMLMITQAAGAETMQDSILAQTNMMPDTAMADNRLPLVILLGASTVISVITLVLIKREISSKNKQDKK